MYVCVIVSDEQGVLLHLLFNAMQCDETLQWTGMIIMMQDSLGGMILS